MSAPNRYALAVSAAALVLGWLGNVLVRDAAPGFGWALWGIVLAAAVAGLARAGGRKVSRRSLAFGIAAVGFAAMFAWRSAWELQVANGVGLALSAGLFLALARDRGSKPLTANDATLGVLRQWAAGVADGFRLFAVDVPWSEVKGSKFQKAAARSARSLLIAAPVIALFGGLFASADAVFAEQIRRWTAWDVVAWGTTLVWVALMALLAAVVLRRSLLGSALAPWPLQAPPAPGEEPRRALVRPLDVAVTLGGLCVLFGAFVVVQADTFFGGSSYIAATPGLTLAEHARSGFFQLVAVAGLALPVVWGSMVAAEAAAPVLRKSIVVLGTALTGLVGLVMASAMVRMDALIDAFGLTNLRLYPAAFMGWLALTLAWLVACVWRQRTEWFATGAVAAGLATIFCLNVANPDAVMASVNVARGPGNVDERHLCSLSADAAPVILANQEALSSQTLADARRDLDGPDDWRQWTVAMVRYRGVE